MADISGFGLVMTITASTTYPAPVTLLNLAKDTDALAIADNVIGDAETGVNGEIISWSTNNPIEVTLSAIPDSLTDMALFNLWNANRPEFGKRGARDVITLTVIMPDGSTQNFKSGKMTSGTPSPGVSGEGKMKTPTFKILFQSIVRTPAIPV